MAAESLAVNHDVYLAYRKAEVGSRFVIPKFQMPFQFEGDLITLARLYHVVRKHDIQILVPTKPKDYVLAGLVSKLLKRKNAGRLGIVRTMKRPLLHRLVYGFLLDGIIVNANEIKEMLLQASFIDAHKVQRIYNGLNQVEIVSKSNEFSPDKPFQWMAVTVGELSPRKNVDLLLKSFTTFLHTNAIKDAGLWIVGGKGQYLETLKDLADELKIKDHVFFTGYVENPYPYIKQSDVFASCSYNEGISNALLEAMALGIAIITTEAGGTKEVIYHEENGMLFSMNDENALSILLLDLYQHPAKVKQITQKAKETIQTQFSIKRMTKELESYFNELVK